MIDDSTTPDSKADPRHNWARMRERMREVIHAELDRIHPTDDSRRALELIIESSVRPSEENGALKLTIIDHEGNKRTTEKDGQTAEFTLQDLLDELRVKYPVLFRPAKPDAAAHAQEAEASRPREKPKRDWLNVDSEPSRPIGDAAIPQEQDVKPTLPERARNTFETLKASITPEPGNRAEDRPVPVVEEHERTVFDAPPARSWARPAIALAAVSFLALLGVGTFLFRGHEAPSPRASASAPAASGPIKEPEPVSTGSTGSVGSLRGVPEVIDTATLSLNGEVVRLFGVEWAPGAGKPEDLTQYLNGREVACDPVGGNDVYRCQVGSQDLSRVVLFNGGGRPTDDATPELKAAAEKAREAKIGVWSKQQP
jgi:endonuclease YncB( thermonuclease family)